jgi:hypothetical protein
MAHIWVVEIWIRSEDGSNYLDWCTDFRFRKGGRSGILAVMWGSDKEVRVHAWVRRWEAREDAAMVRKISRQGWGCENFGVRIAKYIRR